jgi:hypothetical protein
VAAPIPKRIKTAVAPGMTSWNRVVRKISGEMVQHLGGDVSEPEKMLIRRISVIEAELAHMEQKIAADRHRGVEPDERYLDLYSRLANGQRRFLEAAGLKRVPKDVTPTLSEYLLESKKQNEA